MNTAMIEQQSKQVSHTLRLLIIEDDHDSADSLARLMRLAGYDVEVAYTGHVGLLMAQRQPPDVVLLDIDLPRLDGYRVAAELRSREQTKDAFIIAVTGHGNPGDVERAREAGFDLHLLKPVRTEELLAVLRDTAATGRS